MRILIVSDTHGYHKNLDRALESAGEVDMFIHLGDVEGGEEYINAVVGCEKHVVRGNNDFFSDLPKEEEFYIGEKKVFITHGHAYCVSLDPQQIKEEGKARNADIVMFGHTHRPYLEQDGGITVLNPGSLSYPRQEGRKGSYKIIAKIENQEGVDNLDEILAAADGIMVARGDLGVEIPAARVPALQKQMIRKGLQQGKPVITATQMLDSMMRNPRPTRAEVSDIANAVYDGTSCVMLSGETAGGKYPLEALQTMADIVAETEGAIDYWRQFETRRVFPAANINDAITHSCCLTAKDLDAKAILAATSSGHSARMISRFRPACPVAALTMREKVRRQMNIIWGVIPCLTGEVNSTDRIFSLTTDAALKEGLVLPGDVVVITAGVPLGRSGSTNLIKAQEAGK